MKIGLRKQGKKITLLVSKPSGVNYLFSPEGSRFDLSGEGGADFIATLKHFGLRDRVCALIPEGVMNFEGERWE